MMLLFIIVGKLLCPYANSDKMADYIYVNWGPQALSNNIINDYFAFSHFLWLLVN